MDDLNLNTDRLTERIPDDLFELWRKGHQTLDALTVGLRSKKVNWVLDADVESFFDTIDHQWLLTFLEHLRATLTKLKQKLRRRRHWPTGVVGT